MDERRQTVLAFGIAEWDSAVGHLAAAETAMPGIASPYWGQRLSHELVMLCRRWPGGEKVTKNDVIAINTVVTEARIWLTDHQEELGEVLNRE